MIGGEPTFCRLCGSIGLQQVLALGNLPLANALLQEQQLSEADERYPLNLVFCSSCSLVQITETVSPERLFRHYIYFSSFSETMLKHTKECVSHIITSRRLGPESLAIEIASNDGYLLQYYKRANIPVLGIEPAINIATVAKQKGLTTICDFFSAELAERLSTDGLQGDVIHVNNVLAHVPDLNGFVHGLSRVLKEDGVVVVEVPYVKDMIDNSEFDTVYHEHLCYFSLTAVKTLFARNNLFIKKVERLAIHGGTLRLYVEHGSSNPDPSVDRLLNEEASLGVNRFTFYSDFGPRVMRLRDELVALLGNLKSQNKRIAVYGASAKGSTLLNFCGIGKETVDYVVDRSTVKQGLYTPGTGLRIYDPQKVLEDLPDYLLLLTWNFADEILQQQEEYRTRGGRFIIPIPSVRVL